MVEWDGDGYTNREWMRSQWLKQWPDTGLDMHSLETWYRSAMVRNIQPDSEIIDYLTSLNRHQMPWGIVTNGPLTQRDKCKSAGLAQIAPFIIVSDEVGYYKPDPRIFRDALNATGLTNPENVIFVGDNPVADIDGAKRFGMMAAWLHMDRKYPPELTPARLHHRPRPRRANHYGPNVDDLFPLDGDLRITPSKAPINLFPLDGGRLRWGWNPSP